MSEIPLQIVPEQLRKFVDPAAPAAMRTMAAKGLVPIPPKDLVFVQCALVHSADAAIAAAADKSLRGYPESILTGIVKSDLPSVIIDQLGPRLVGKPALLEGYLLNKAVSDDALAALTPELDEALVGLLLQNEERILRSVPLVMALKAHPAASRASLDRMFDFLVRSGVIIDGVSELADAMARLTNDERLQAVANIEVPPDLLDPALADPAAPVVAPLAPPADDVLEIEAELLPADAEEEEEVQVPLLKRINNMSTAQKVAVALKGNKEVRTVLLRDTNKIVAVAAIKNPRITEQEVTAVAQSKSANEEVIRIISVNREWTRGYAVKLALVMNPKTPTGVAMRFLPLLNHSDLKNIAKSKNIPQAIVNQAKQALSRVNH